MSKIKNTAKELPSEREQQIFEKWATKLLYNQHQMTALEVKQAREFIDDLLSGRKIYITIE